MAFSGDEVAGPEESDAGQGSGDGDFHDVDPVVIDALRGHVFGVPVRQCAADEVSGELGAVLNCGRRAGTVARPLTCAVDEGGADVQGDRKSTRLNSSHVSISYAVFCLKKKNEHENGTRGGGGG